MTRRAVAALLFVVAMAPVLTGAAVAGAAVPRGPHLAVVIGKRLLLIGPDGRSRRRIHTDPDAEAVIAGGPVWSPDGRELAFWSPRVDQPAISLIRADGSNFRLDGSGVTPYGPPAFDPTNGHLVFVGGGLEQVPGAPLPTGSYIWSQQPTSSEAHLLGVTDGFIAPQFSFAPNGIAAATVSGRPEGAERGTRLVTFDPHRKLLHTVVPLQGGGPRDPAVSPDGTEIAYVRYFPGVDTAAGKQIPPTDLMMVPFAGGKPTRIAQIPGRASSLSWDPSGSRLAYVTEEAVMEINADGTCRTKVFSAPVDGAAWQPGAGRGVGPLSC